jgi:hypothetical protein
VYFVVNWYIFPRVGILYQEKSGNPVASVFIRTVLQNVAHVSLIEHVQRQFLSPESTREKGIHAGCQGCQIVVFKPKIAIWVNFGGKCNGRCWYILWTFGLSY